MLSLLRAVLVFIVLLPVMVFANEVKAKTNQLICISGDTKLTEAVQPSGIISDANAVNRSFPRWQDGTGNKVFIFDPKKLAWGAYNNRGRLVASGRASGGANYCRDVGRACRTPRGEFKVHRKGSSYCRSGKYPLPRGGAPMPHCMHFYRGYAIHGSPDVPNRNASHGCIRVLPKDAKWLNKNFIDVGTTVVVRPY